MKGTDDLISPVDTKSIVVIDFGSYYTKIGYSGNDRPKMIFPTCVASAKEQNDLDSGTSKM